MMPRAKPACQKAQSQTALTWVPMSGSATKPPGKAAISGTKMTAMKKYVVPRRTALLSASMTPRLKSRAASSMLMTTMKAPKADI